MSEAHEALCQCLDEDGAAPAGGEEAAAANDSTALHTQLQAEHEARLKAEAACVDRVQRLAVHTEQVAEYAKQKASDLAELKSRAEELQTALRAQPADGGAAHIERLLGYLNDAASDAHGFAQQAREDASRHRMTDAATDATASDEGAAVGGSRSVMSDAMETEPAAGEAGEAVASPPATPTSAQLRSSDDAAAAATGETASSDASCDCATRAKFIPMRLDPQERRLFAVLEATLGVSDYTDRVDILTWQSKSERIVAQVKDICSILSGLRVAQDYRAGQALVRDRDFKRNGAFFQQAFEVGRRYKVMNPDRMRATYGKLLYMLMDTASPAISELLEFSCITPLNTVAHFLEARGAEALLADPLMAAATREIDAAGRARAAIQEDIRRKEAARKSLAKKYASRRASPEDILNAIYSFSDNNTYLRFNRDPVDRMLAYLREHFDPRDPAKGSLAISSGRAGARLSHSHERQYAYVLQSLLLWREISTDMFRLWKLAEEDLLSENSRYRLCDTGQGLNRVQAAPRVGRAMARILARCQAQVGGWVGSSVVHLGDTNVPNALMFIDKYTQVPRILNPLVQVLDEVPRMAAREPKVGAYLDAAFGGADACVRAVCTDFFQHAFDGSGADNFFDAGSCIDGRLTSAWNWCAKLEKKPYATVFKMAGFSGFDGDFK